MKLLCAVCIREGVPESLAAIGPDEELYATSDGEPACSTCGLLHNLALTKPGLVRSRGEMFRAGPLITEE